MIDAFFITLGAQALLLCLAMWLVSRHEADLDFQKASLVVALTVLTSALVRAVLDPHLPPGLTAFTGLLVAPVMALLLVKVCWLPWQKAVLATTLYLLVGLALRLGIERVLNAMVADSEKNSIQARHEDDLMEAKEFMEESFGHLAKTIENEARHHPAATPTLPIPADVLPEPENAAKPGPAVATPPDDAPAIPVPPPPPPPATSDAPPAITDNPSPVPVDDAAWGRAQNLIKVASIMRRAGGAEWVATVNGRMIEAGGMLVVEHDQRHFHFRAARMEGRTIVWERVAVTP